MSDRPELMLSEAAAAVAVSREAIRRRLEADAFPNARRLAQPVTALAGDTPRASAAVPCVLS